MMDMQQMLKLLLANQKKAEAAKEEEMLAEMNAKLDANRTKTGDDRETGKGMEEAAQGPESGRRAPPEAKGKDPGNL
jgi:hypothetical protein